MDKFFIDSHKLIYHPDRVAELAKAGNDWNKHKFLKPLYAEISTSGACNHRCTFCSVDYIGYKSVFITRKTLKDFFSSGEKLGLKAVMFAGDGEPLLNPEINGIVNDARQHKIDTSFTTNGVHIRESFIEEAMHNVSWIKVSMNAGTADVYEKVHRTSEKDFEKVWENLSRAIEYRNRNRDTVQTTIGIQSLILPDNINSLMDLAHRSADSGADYLVLKPYVHNVYMNQPGYNDIDYTQKTYKETISKIKDVYESAAFKIISRDNALSKLLGEKERYNTCWSTPALWFYVSGDGSVYACGAHVGNPNFLLGNINNESIEAIWKSDNRRDCLCYVQNELDLNDCRRTCRMDEVNAYLSQVIDESPTHVNFI